MGLTFESPCDYVPPDFFDDGITLTENQLGSHSTIAEFVRQGDNPVPLIASVATCYVLNMGGALIEFKYRFTTGAPATGRQVQGNSGKTAMTRGDKRGVKQLLRRSHQP